MSIRPLIITPLNFRWYVVLALAIIVVDRISKAYMRSLDSYQITSWLRIQPTLNRGISWGMLNSNGTCIFVMLSILIMAFIVLLIRYARERYHNSSFIIGETLVIVGACSNVIDRLWYHGVVDFIVISYGTWVWPSFNVADAAIVCGACIMIFSSLRDV
jgi:signal peptidase II